MKKVEQLEMVLYRCPYCGELQLREVKNIQGDVWICLFCKTEMQLG